MTAATATRRLTAEPRGRVEYRSAEAVDVSFRDRTIEVLAVPYGEQAVVNYQGRLVIETIANVAFAGVDKQENRDRIRATREHDPRLLFGLVTEIDPFCKEGLHAQLQVARTALGNETLVLAREQLLDASIGFRVPDLDGEKWEGRTRRRIVKAWLHEISLVADPAYAGSKVLAVR